MHHHGIVLWPTDYGILVASLKREGLQPAGKSKLSLPDIKLNQALP